MGKKVKLFHIKFNLHHKMPVSQIGSVSELGEEASHGNATSTTGKRLKTTNKMVADALIQLHTARGVSLRHIYKYIMDTYLLESLSKIRVLLIKKYLIHLRESEDIVNISGKGFSGKFKLVDKKQFSKKIELEEKISKEAARQQRLKARSAKGAGLPKSKTKVKKANKQPTIISKPVIPRQVTPEPLRNIYKNTSMFDTPMVATQVHSSTPFVGTEYVPRAPEINQRRVNRKNDASDDCATPRTSLPGKRRRLMQRIQ